MLRILVVLLLLFAACTRGRCPPLDPVVGAPPNLRVTGGMADYEAEPSLAVAGRAVVVLFRAFHGGPSRIGVVSSANAGRTFSPPTEPFPSDATGQTDPAIAVDDRGRWHAVWAEYRAGLGANLRATEIRYAASVDAGSTWSPPRTLATAGRDTILDRPWVAVGAGGFVIITFARAYSTTGRSDLVLVASSDGGRTFGGEQAVPHPAGGRSALLGQPCGLPEGAVIAWLEQRDRQSGVYAAAWKPGGGFLAPVRVDDPLGSATIDAPAVAAHGNSVAVVYVAATREGGSEVLMARSADAGRSFGKASRVAAGPACARRIHPRVALTGSGLSEVAWYEGRGDAGAVMLAPARRLAAEAFPFTTSVAAPSWLGDYAGMVADGSRIWMAWADGREGSSHVFLASWADEPN